MTSLASPVTPMLNPVGNPNRSHLVAVLPESEGDLEVLTLKVPSKLKARIDAAAKRAGQNRTQTMLALMRHALPTLEAELSEQRSPEPDAKKPKSR